MKPHCLLDLWLIFDLLMVGNGWVHSTALLSEDNDSVSILSLATDFHVTLKKLIFSSFLMPARFPWLLPVVQKALGGWEDKTE